MKLISEAEIKAELQDVKTKVYYIPEGRILSPAARDYLNRERIQIDVEKNRPAEGHLQENGLSNDGQKSCQEEKKLIHMRKSETNVGIGYYDYKTGAGYQKKPEFMTHIYGNELVLKNDSMIRYRGKLDRVQAEIILAQSVVSQSVGKTELLKDLGEVLVVLRKLMRCELMKESVDVELIIGLNRKELREHSHHAEKYYGVKTMDLPDYGKGMEYALLNLLRTSVREAEVMAVDAFGRGCKVERLDIIEILNRLSSAFHIMMCKYVAGEYDKK